MVATRAPARAPGTGSGLQADSSAPHLRPGGRWYREVTTARHDGPVTELRFPDGQQMTVEETRPDFVLSAWVPAGHRGPPAHRHRRQAETFTILQGRLLVRVGRFRRVLTAGESVTVPPGTTHAFSNPYDEPVGFRTVESPAGPLHAQLQALAAARGAPPLLELAEINAAHDWSFTLAGLPDGPQRVLWRALAAAARLRR